MVVVCGYQRRVGAVMVQVNSKRVRGEKMSGGGLRWVVSPVTEEEKKVREGVGEMKTKVYVPSKKIYIYNFFCLFLFFEIIRMILLFKRSYLILIMQGTECVRGCLSQGQLQKVKSGKKSCLPSFFFLKFIFFIL